MKFAKKASKKAAGKAKRYNAKLERKERAHMAKVKLGHKRLESKEKYHIAKAHKKWAGDRKAGVSTRPVRGKAAKPVWAKYGRGRAVPKKEKK